MIIAYNKHIVWFNLNNLCVFYVKFFVAKFVVQYKGENITLKIKHGEITEYWKNVCDIIFV